ncbi:hypothetical protein [Burkholderia multivorans]|uniref:hypothetical protein n=1 Tax=Burkholderia multivorans TaxID=87883 RepID=UPI001E4F9C1E|nr:hypothetical protein [Burkholderia multivorans]
MNDQQQIRADALTEAERLLLARVNDCTKPIDAADRNGILKLIDRLAASQSSQPAAAPIDTPTDREFALSAAICVHPKGVYGDEGGSMCCPITHTRDASFAPPPADERAAFEYDDVVSICDAHGICLPVDCVEMVVEIVKRSGLLAARAASANETGAEGVPLAMALNPNAPPLTMALGLAQAAEPVAWAVYNGWSRICFYMTEEDARDHAQKAQKNHDLSGSLAAFRVVPLYAAPQPAQADARVGLTEQAITDAVKKWFPDRAYQAPFFARALLQGANHV